MIFIHYIIIILVFIWMLYDLLNDNQVKRILRNIKNKLNKDKK